MLKLKAILVCFCCVITDAKILKQPGIQKLDNLKEDDPNAHEGVFGFDESKTEHD